MYDMDKENEAKGISEKEAKAEKIKRMQDYAKRYLARHPKTKPERLQKIVCKKFNVKLT